MEREQHCLELVLVAWVDALRRRDLATIERHLHPDVVWNGMRADLGCPDRAAVIENLRRAEIPPIDGIELLAERNKVLFGARSPDFTERFGVQLDGAIYDVFTIRDELIVAIEEFGERDAALAELRRPDPLAGEQPTPEELPRMPRSGRVEDLIPFVHVSDVARSVAFYELLGFELDETHHHDGRLDWASLHSDQGRLMLAHASHPIHAGEQAVLFYLYSRDLPALREHLLAHRLRPGPIVDGSPGPEQELRLYDPDGWCLMIAQKDVGAGS